MKELEIKQEEKPGREDRRFSVYRKAPVSILLPRDFVGDREAVRNIAANIDETKSLTVHLTEQFLMGMAIDAEEISE